MQEAEAVTAECSALTLTIALSYSGRRGSHTFAQLRCKPYLFCVAPRESRQKPTVTYGPAPHLLSRSDLAEAARRLAERAASSSVGHPSHQAHGHIAGHSSIGDREEQSGARGGANGNSSDGARCGPDDATWEEQLSAELSTTKAWAGVRCSHASLSPHGLSPIPRTRLGVPLHAADDHGPPTQL